MYNFKDAQIAGAKALKETEEMDALLPTVPHIVKKPTESPKTDDGLPPWASGVEFLRSANDVKERPVLIGGPDGSEDGAILRDRCKLVIGGASKAGKTWLLMDLALSVACGGKWMDHFRCRKGRVLYVNLELHPDTAGSRGAWVGKERGYIKENAGGPQFADPADADNLVVWNLRGSCYDINEMLEVAAMRHAAGEERFSLIILDPLYKVLGDRDENAAGDMAELFTLVEDFAKVSNASIAFAAHFSKGGQAGKEAVDRISGSGVMARDPDAILTMTPHELDGHHVLSASLREFKPIPEMVFSWAAPVMSPAHGIDPSLLKKPGKTQEAWIAKAQAVLATLDSSPTLPVNESILEAIAKTNSPESGKMWLASLDAHQGAMEATYGVRKLVVNKVWTYTTTPRGTMPF